MTIAEREAEKSFISLSTKYYGEKLEEYENKRLSEQELYEAKQLLLRYSSWRSGKFYVNLSEDESVKNRSLAEMKYFLRWPERKAVVGRKMF